MYRQISDRSDASNKSWNAAVGGIILRSRTLAAGEAYSVPGVGRRERSSGSVGFDRALVGRPPTAVTPPHRRFCPAAELAGVRRRGRWGLLQAAVGLHVVERTGTPPVGSD